MQLNDIEIKLATLALNGGAQAGEISNGAEMFFRALRKRGVSAQDFIRNGGSYDSTGLDYKSLWANERMSSSMYRIEAADAKKEATELKVKLDELTRKLNERHHPSRPAKAKGELLSDLEWSILCRICEYWAQGGIPTGDSVRTTYIAENNSERGCLSTMIRKGLIEKRYDGRVGATEAGIKYYVERKARV